METSKPTITYFGFRGRAEVPRLILEIAGVDYDFVPVAGNWKENLGSILLPFGQVPLYQEGSFHLVQTQAIIRYLARKHGFAGSNNEELTRIDEIAEGVIDGLTTWALILYGPKDAKEASIKSLASDKLPRTLSQFSALLQRNNQGKGYFVGEKLSYVDLMFFDYVWRIETLSEECKAVLNKYPDIIAHYQRVGALPKVAAFYASDPYKS